MSQVILYETLQRPLEIEEVDENMRIVQTVADLQPAVIAAADMVSSNIDDIQNAADNAATAALSAGTATTQAGIATQKAVAAAASAETARAIVGIPPAYNSLIMQPNRIDTDMTIPDGFNAVMFGDFEIGPNITITLLGNSQFIVI